MARQPRGRGRLVVYTRRLFRHGAARLQSPAMRIITLNVNGIRSAERRGLARWLARVEPWDVVCLQEMRADEPTCPARCGRRASARPHSIRRSARATRASASTRKPAATFGPASATANSTARAATCRRISRELSVISLYLPSGFERTAPAGVEVPLSRRVPAASRELRATEAGDHPVRRLEHRAPADRPQELAQQPEEFRLPARRARVAHARVRRAGLRRRLPPRRPAPGAVHVVVQPRPGVGEERRLAHRLPDRHARHRRDGARRVDLQEPALLRSCAADHRLRLRACGEPDAAHRAI